MPRATGDGWSTASLADVGLDTESFVDLVEFVDDDEAWAMHGIVVVKDDKLVFEQYFDGHRFDYDDPQFRGEQVSYVLGHRLVDPSDQAFGEFFEQATGVSIDEYSQTHLFGPLGITDYEWQYINPEIVYASGELELRPRDLAKFGSLYLNGGVWNGTQVISNAWVETSIREHVSIPGRSADGDGYGYQWFTRTFESEGEPVAAALRTGWGGQALIVFPEHDTLVVLTAGDYLLQRQLTDLITGHLVPAIAATV